MSKHKVIERESCGTKSWFCDCGFGEKDPQHQDVILNHYFQSQYIASIQHSSTFKKWTGFKKGSYFNPERKESKEIPEVVSRAMVEELVKRGSDKPEEKEPHVKESVKISTTSKTSDETKDERGGSI